jgi:hypothetical protein
MKILKLINKSIVSIIINYTTLAKTRITTRRRVIFIIIITSLRKNLSLALSILKFITIIITPLSYLRLSYINTSEEVIY